MYCNRQNFSDFNLPFKYHIFAKTCLIQAFLNCKSSNHEYFRQAITAVQGGKRLIRASAGRQVEHLSLVIGRYERDEMTPSVEVAKKMAQLLDTTVGYLLGEVQQSDTFKDPAMLKRLQQINTLPEADRHCILYAIDNLLASATTRLAYIK